MGTIEQMDEEYTNALAEGKTLEELYLADLNRIHVYKRQINDVRGRYIFKAYLLLLTSLWLPIILGIIYIA